MTSKGPTMTTENTLIDAIPASVPPRSIRYGKPTDLPYLIHLQKQWSQNVGFLPSSAFKRYLSTNQVLLVNEGGLEAGYLIWTFRHDGLVRIPQVAISPELLRTTLGSRIMNSITRSARSHSCSIIRLTSRSDLAANKFWPLFGFTPTAVIARPTTRGLPLIEWTLQLTDAATIAHLLATGGRPYRLGKRPPPSPPIDACSPTPQSA